MISRCLFAKPAMSCSRSRQRASGLRRSAPMPEHGASTNTTSALPRTASSWRSSHRHRLHVRDSRSPRTPTQLLELGGIDVGRDDLPAIAQSRRDRERLAACACANRRSSACPGVASSASSWLPSSCASNAPRLNAADANSSSGCREQRGVAPAARLVAGSSFASSAAAPRASPRAGSHGPSSVRVR